MKLQALQLARKLEIQLEEKRSPFLAMADADQIQRLRVMCELLETEATYVKEITALVASVTKLDWEVRK